MLDLQMRWSNPCMAFQLSQSGFSVTLTKTFWWELTIVLCMVVWNVICLFVSISNCSLKDAKVVLWTEALPDLSKMSHLEMRWNHLWTLQLAPHHSQGPWQRQWHRFFETHSLPMTMTYFKKNPTSWSFLQASDCLDFYVSNMSDLQVRKNHLCMALQLAQQINDLLRQLQSNVNVNPAFAKPFKIIQSLGSQWPWRWQSHRLFATHCHIALLVNLNLSRLLLVQDVTCMLDLQMRGSIPFMAFQLSQQRWSKIIFAVTSANHASLGSQWHWQRLFGEEWQLFCAWLCGMKFVCLYLSAIVLWKTPNSSCEQKPCLACPTCHIWRWGETIFGLCSWRRTILRDHDTDHDTDFLKRILCLFNLFRLLLLQHVRIASEAKPSLHGFAVGATTDDPLVYSW